MASPNSAQLRLMSDLNALTADPPEGCSAAPCSDDDLFTWQAAISGPEDTPFENGIYNLRIQFTKDYPSRPPKVRFLSDMFHPNIYQDGSLCLDILMDKWSPIYNVSSILTSIQSLLSDPNINSPANPEAAGLYAKDRKAYNKRVRACAEKTLE